MRKRRLLTLILAGGLTAATAPQAAPQRWTRIATMAGFSVEEPVGWQSLGVAGERLDIVNGACRREGAVICDGEAEILVRAEPFAAKPSALKPKSCWSLQQTVSETAAAGRRLENSQLTCTIGDRRFVILERHWKGDKHAASYGRIAMRMAKSLRYPG
jgi:hypothetical protein